MIAREPSDVEQVRHYTIAAHSPWLSTTTGALSHHSIVEEEDKVDDLGVALTLVEASEGVEIAEWSVEGKGKVSRAEEKATAPLKYLEVVLLQLPTTRDDSPV